MVGRLRFESQPCHSNLTLAKGAKFAVLSGVSVTSQSSVSVSSCMPNSVDGTPPSVLLCSVMQQFEKSSLDNFMFTLPGW